MKILLLEDDTVLADILVDFLQETYEVTHTYSIKKALVLSEKSSFDLYIFDINVPDGSGISLLKELRAFKDETPTIFITAFPGTKYLKKAFESGANDFIKKPFDLEELAQRIENIKRHFGLTSLIQIAPDIEFNTKSNIIKICTKTKNISNKEGKILHYLYKNRHRVISVDEMLQNLWKYDEMPSGDAVRTIIKELRKHIGKEHILNIRAEGYRFK